MSKEGDPEKSIGFWVNTNTGESVTVYKPRDFDETNPVYHMKIWDANGNIREERRRYSGRTNQTKWLL